MRIGIDAHMLGDHSGGNESFYTGILNAFDTNDGNEYILFMKPGIDDSAYRDRFKIVRFKSSNAFFRNFVEMTRLCREYKLDVLHTQYYIPFIRPCKTVVTIHDISFEHNGNLFTKGECYRNKLLIPYSAKHSDHIITDSEFCREDISNIYKVPKDKMDILYCAVDNDFRVLSAEEKDRIGIRTKYNLGNNNYILCVGNIHPRKNLPRLIKAFVMYKEKNNNDMKLVICGKKAWMFDEVLEEAKAYKDEVIFTGYVEKEELVALLNEATGFVYPSFFEGFGIPPLEAIACGTKVAVADIQVMHEVLDDAAVFFDPYDISSISDGIEKISMPDEGSGTGYAKILQKYSWKLSAAKLKEIYRLVYENRN